MPYQITPQDEKTLDFMLNSNQGQGPLAQFLNMAGNRRSLEPANSTVNKFAMGGQMDPRTQALLTRLAQMRQPLQSSDADAAGNY